MRIPAVAVSVITIGAGLALLAVPSANPTSAWAAPAPAVLVPARAVHALGTQADAINNLGLTRFQNIYAGDLSNPDGSVTVYLARGSTTPFMSAVSSLLSSPAVQALGARPAITTVRVPESIADLDRSSRSMVSGFTALKADGFRTAYWEPDPRRGTLDVYLSATPHHMSAAAATAILQRKISQLVRVTTTTAPAQRFFYNRQQDAIPFYAGDLIVTSDGTEACSTGFTVIGTDGYPRAMTDGHCGATTFTNGGYTVNSSFQVVPSGGSKQTLGTTSDYQYGNGYDVQLLENSDESGFSPLVWVGVGTSQPTAMAVGSPMTDFPAVNSQLTTDGAVNRTVRYVPVQAAGSGVCVTLSESAGPICDLIQLAGTSAQGVSPTARPGDSGGPVFCYACVANAVTPAGLVEGGSSPGDPVFATFIGTDLSELDAIMETS
jgi:hypothetical protein